MRVGSFPLLLVGPMTFANPWGLLGLLAVPAILAIHLYHQRFPPLVVGGMHLWGAEIETRSAGRRRERLPITATLLLELLAALLLTIALSRPVVGGLGGGQHLVVVLDDSASMQAVPKGDQSFRDLALLELERRVEALPRRSVVTVVLTGRRPRTLTEPMSPWADVKAALNDWRPRSPRHEFQPAWDLAAQLAENSGSLLFLTDDLPSSLVDAKEDEDADEPEAEPADPDAESVGGIPKGMEVVSVGQPLDNVAIAAAHWKLVPETNEVPDGDSTRTEIVGYVGHVHVRITNHGRLDRTVTVRGTRDGEEAFAARVPVPAGASVPHAAQVPGGIGTLTVTVESPNDPLAVDDTATLVEPRLRPLRVALALPADHPGHRSVQRAFDAVPEVTYVESDEAALVVAPVAEEPPPIRPDLWWLSLGPIDPTEAARSGARDLRGPYLVERRNPVLTDVYLDGVLWGGVQDVETDVAPLVSAGATPLVGRRLDTESRAYLVNVDLSRPNLVDSRDWPKLVSNLAELARDDQPGLRRWNYRLGEVLRFRLYHTVEGGFQEGREVTVADPERERKLPRTAIVETPPLDEVGVHEIRDGEDLVGRVAVNFFDPFESRSLRFLTPGKHVPTEDNAVVAFSRDDPYTWMLVLALVLVIAALFADWVVLRPRRRSTA